MNETTQTTLLFIITLFILLSTIILLSGIASTEDINFCENHNGEILYFIFVPLQKCNISECNHSYDGIKFCNEKMFIIKNNKFYE